MKKIALPFLLALLSLIVRAQKQQVFDVRSPNGKIAIRVEMADRIYWSVSENNQPVITPSTISLTLGDGQVLGDHPRIISARTSRNSGLISTPIYKKQSVADNYQELVVKCKSDYGIIFRAYDDGVAYRFFTLRKEEIIIQSEEANFNFETDYNSFMPHVRDFRTKDQYTQSFEALYTETSLSKANKDTLSFLPVLVAEKDNRKVVILEADLEEYPGMFLLPNAAGTGLKGVFAPYALEEAWAGYRSINKVVTRRADYIARVQGSRSFPWRVLVISDRDADLANNDMMQRLASPSRIKDISWIRPGKVAWDWWNDWNISHVDFRAGINTETYKYYIDFAAENHLEYIIMDEGWSNDQDLMEISPKINLQEIVDYGKQKNVGVILWATWLASDAKTEEAFTKYASMGVKGFKIDFMDRDDQKLVSSLFRIARSAADHKLLLDFHGMYKPSGINKTFPNILNCEGVKGMENVKWTPHDDVPHYDLSIPFIRMVAGPMDYTPGAMRNATQAQFHPVNSMPMSQGTRCHQLAMYVIFEAPLQMLSDNPTIYRKEQESTDFIAQIPTTFDETVAIDGKLGEYLVLARRKDKTWYIGAMGNWDERDISIDCSFLGQGRYEAVIFQDGINADRDATDYKKETSTLSKESKLKIHLSTGGGWAARLTELK